MKQLFVFFLLMICHFLSVYSEHFFGGTVTWKPMNKTATGDKISIMITQSYQWSLKKVPCDQSKINNKISLIPNSNETVRCARSSSQCANYVPIYIRGYCTDFSTNSDTSSSQISTIQNITSGSKFCISYTGKNWVKLSTINCSNGRRKRILERDIQTNKYVDNMKTIRNIRNTQTCSRIDLGYSIGCCIDLTLRPDDFLNSPPVATIISPIKVQINTFTTIRIPVIDADNDFIRCRWAENTSELDECGDVCRAAPDVELYENCTVTFNSTGKTVGTFYVISLMIEDFYNQSTNTSYSRIPVQFLIEIINSSSCFSKPIIDTILPDCTPIRIGILFNFTVNIENRCDGRRIQDLVRAPPINMFKSPIINSSSSNIYTITERWTPSADQVGSQVYCAIATDNYGLQSDMYCVTFTVVSQNDNMLCPGITQSITTTSTTTTTTIPTISTTTITITTIPTISTTITTITTTTTTTTRVAIGKGNTMNVKEESVLTVTVLVPVSTIDSSRELGFGLGFGLALLALLTLYILIKFCCQSVKPISKTTIIKKEEEKTAEDQKHTDSHISNYREQYINNSENIRETTELDESTEKPLVLPETSFISTALSDHNVGNLNITTTSLFSPSIVSLPNDEIQFTDNYTFSTSNLMDQSSFLICAHYEQENQRSIYPPKL